MGVAGVGVVMVAFGNLKGGLSCTSLNFAGGMSTSLGFGPILPVPCQPSMMQVVLVANSLPAINDVTAAELRSVSAACGRGRLLAAAVGMPFTA